MSSALLESFSAMLMEVCREGEDAFTLHDTHGVPIEVTEDLCRAHGLEVDTEQFLELKKQAKVCLICKVFIINRRQSTYSDTLKEPEWVHKIYFVRYIGFEQTL